MPPNEILVTQPAEVRLLLTPREAAAALAISPRTLWQLTARGELVPLRLPGRGVAARSIRYRVDDLQEWIRATIAAQRNVRPE